MVKPECHPDHYWIRVMVFSCERLSPELLLLLLSLMRQMSCWNKFYYPTDDRNMKSKLFIQKSKINYAYQKDCKQEASLRLIKIGSKNRITISWHKLIGKRSPVWRHTMKQNYLFILMFSFDILHVHDSLDMISSEAKGLQGVKLTLSDQC